jgi:pimeloyl-ACP methyl ester carboxylesterase
MNRSICLIGITAAVLVLVGCADQTPERASSRSSAAGDPSSVSHTLPEVSLPIAEGADVSGLVAVGGHDLAVHCKGSGHPTVVILHGWIDQPGITSHGYYGALRDELEPDFRVCSYDRANVGDSETVPGTQTPEMVVADLDGLLEALGDPGPYILVAQSAGGMVASAYAVAHPDKVAGIVMVDASFDEEITIEDVGMVPDGVGPCDPESRRLDGEESLQKIDNCAMYSWAYERRDLRPRVPLVYLAAAQAPWSDQTELGPAYAEAIIPLQQSYAASWSPGKFEWVDSGHDIHLENPGAVTEAVRWVVSEGGR